jgi:hypothetical protein
MLPATVIGSGLALAYMWGSGPSNTTRVRAALDGREYQVQELPNKQGAAELMAKLRANLVKLRDAYARDQGSLADPPIRRFVERFKSDQMMENDMGSDSTAYSENKGDVIVVCLRDKTKPPSYPLVDENTLMFVLLHEMAHLMTESIGHTPEFWNNFRKILQDAVQQGVWQQRNYARTPVP